MRNIGIGQSPRLRVLHRESIALDNSVKAYLEVARIHAVHSNPFNLRSYDRNMANDIDFA